MILWAIAACAAGPEPVDPAVPVPVEAPGPVTPSEAERHCANLRFRDNATVFDASAGWLVAHPDEALPVLVARLDAGAPESVGILKVLPKIPGRAGVDALDRALAKGDELRVGYVASALARHPDPEALEVLRRGVASPNREVKNAALRGLGERGDAAACPDVLGAVGDPDVNTRTYAVRSGLALGCVDADLRARLASDPSEQVRALLNAP